MNAELLAVLEYWEREKGISRDILVRAVEEALVSAARRAVGPARELRCSIDPKTGSIKAFARLIVSDKLISDDQISVAEARKLKPDAQIGDEVEVEVTRGFPADRGAERAAGRDAATAKGRKAVDSRSSRIASATSSAAWSGGSNGRTSSWTWGDTRRCCRIGSGCRSRNTRPASGCAPT
jgi:hypothetical protein